MGKKSKTGRDIESGRLLLFIYRNRAPLVTVTIAALVVSVVVSLLITPRYRSTVVLYPAPTASISRTLFGPAAARADMISFGLETDTERLLQILQSDVIREKMTGKYNLIEHYGISWESRYPYTALNKKYLNNVRSRKTEFMAIEIEVLDEDPSVAAAMANDIAAHIDSVMNGMLNERAEKSLAIIGEEYRRLGAEVQAMQDSLRKIRELGVTDYESQSEVLNNAYATAILNRDTAGMNFFRERIRVLSTWGGSYVSLRDNLLYMTENLNDLKQVYEQARVNAEGLLPYKFVVDKAREAEKKTYPVRSLIVAVSVMSAFLLTLFALLLLEAFRKQVLTKNKS